MISYELRVTSYELRVTIQSSILNPQSSIQFKAFSYNFVVIEMVLHALNDLVVLVSFASDEDDIAWASHHTGCSDSLTSVNDVENRTPLLVCQSCQHIVDDFLRVFVLASYVPKV